MIKLDRILKLKNLKVILIPFMNQLELGIFKKPFINIIKEFKLIPLQLVHVY
jgi:hypothetical protein